jgi:hypothetical protein
MNQLASKRTCRHEPQQYDGLWRLPARHDHAYLFAISHTLTCVLKLIGNSIKIGVEQKGWLVAEAALLIETEGR